MPRSPLDNPVPPQSLKDLDKTRVQHQPSLLEQTVISHLVGEGVLEHQLTLGKQSGFIEELSSLPNCARPQVQRCLGQVSDGLELRQGSLIAEDRSSLQQVLLLRRQAVHACCEYSLYCGRYLDWRQRLGQPIRPARARPVVRSPPAYSHALFQEEGITRGPSDQQRLQHLQAGAVTEQGLQEGVNTGRRQGVQAELRIVRLAAPGVLVLPVR